MADPRLARLAAGAAAPRARTRPLLSPRQAQEQVLGPAKPPGGTPSLFDQLGGLVGGLPGGVAGLIGETAQSVAGFPRLAVDVGSNIARGRSPGEGFSTDYGENLGSYFPLLEQFRHSATDTGYRLSHPGEYVKAAREGRILPAIVEDAANLSVVAGPAAKLAGAGAGAGAVAATRAAEEASTVAAKGSVARAAAEAAYTGVPRAPAEVAATALKEGAEAGRVAAERATARAPGRFQPAFLTPQRFPRPSTVTPGEVARPGLLRAGQAIERVARPVEEVAGAPARVWAAPVKLATGVELPTQIFGRTAEGAPRRFGIKPVLDRTGITERVMQTPRVAEAAEKFTDWRAERKMRRTFRQEQLLPPSAEIHIQATDLQRDLGPAEKVLGSDLTLMHATNLLRTGLADTLDLVPRLEAQLEQELPGTVNAAEREARRNTVLAETFGLPQGPTPEVIKTVLDYQHGTLDPTTKARIDTALELVGTPVDILERRKIERGQLNEQQTGQVPMESKVQAITAASYERAQALRDELEGRDVGGKHVPGLREEAAAAQAQVPQADLPRLAGQLQAARRAGAVESEATLAGQRAERGYAQAETVAQQGDRARLATLRGAREEMAQLQREQYGREMGPEWTQGQLQAGRAERAAGPTLPPVPAGHVRLWRGEGEGFSPAEGALPDWMTAQRGRWFSDDPAKALGYTKPGGQLHWVDVPEAAAQQLRLAAPNEVAGPSGRSWEFMVPDEMAQAAREHAVPYEQAAAATQGPSRVPFTVPEREYQLAERLARLEGEGRTAGVEQQAPRAAAATERATGARERAAAAEGRIFTAGAEPVYAPGARPLPFGEMGPTDRGAVAQMSDAEAARYVRDVRRRVRDQMRERRYELENRVSQAGGAGLPIQIPARDSAMWDAYQEIQQALGRSAGSASGAFRNPRFAVGTGGVKGATESLFARDRGTPLDVVLSRYGEAGDMNASLAALLDDIRLVQEWKGAEGAVIKQGLEGRVGEEYTSNPVESAALAFGEIPAAVAALREAHTEYVMPEARLGPSPWTMKRDDYVNDLVGAQQVVDDAGPYESWTPQAHQAEQRLVELVPESVGDIVGLTDEQLYDRVLEAAQLAGREVPEQPSALLAAGEAGRAPVREARAVASEAFLADQRLREFAAANEQPPPSTQQLERTRLPADTQRLYDAVAAREKEAVAGERLGEARTRLTAGIREEGEAAGQRVGEAVGAERVLTKQAAQAEQRAETLGPKVEPALERAQAEAEARAATSVRFGERRGKRLAEVRDLQREIRTAEGKLSWLEDEAIPQMEMRLAQGPKEVAPGKYQPGLMAAERFQAAAMRMGEQLAEQTGDPSMASAFAGIAADAATTMDKMHAKGMYPEYLPGALDRPTRGTPTMAGGQEQIPWSRKAPSAHQKRYGHVPMEVRTVHRALVNDIRVMVEQDAAVKIRDEVAHQGHELIDEALQRGELEPWLGEHLKGPVASGGKPGRAPEDFAKQMEEYGYTAWDPEKPTAVPDRLAGPDSYYLPTPIYKEYQRWWKPANPNGAVRVYDQITRGFKHGVLAMSPTWHVNNVLGNAFMAVVFGGESPAAIYRATRDVLQQMRAGGREARARMPELPTVPGGVLSRSGRAVVNRVGPLRRVREWGRDIAASPPVGPPRLYGAGGAAEISRQFAELTPPRTMFGRGLQLSYRGNEMVDNIGRTMLYQLKRNKGFDAEQSVGLALQAMGDFSNMSRFERDVVRRIVPFYAWMRHITQASVKLAVEHPWRTAWMLNVSNLFNPKNQDTGVPEWLRGGLGLGGGWYVPFGGANPLQGNVGSIFTSPKNWPGEGLRSLNPVIKTAAGAVGINLSQARAVTRPPGTGPLTQYGQPMWSWQAPNEIAYMALRQVPQGRLFTDLVYNPGANEVLPEPVLRYDTGQVIRRQRRPIPQTGGRFGGVIRNLNVPFFPTYVDEAQTRARIVKGERAAARARASYNA